jgi:eukaryotic-like serine/threonine-protein kinase
MGDALRYRAIRRIANGGSAEVFYGEQTGAAGFRRDVVLKRIHPKLWVNEQFRQMLIDEAHLAMSLTHPNLVQVLDVGESAGTSFLVLELVDGWTLAQISKRGKEAAMPLGPELACYIAAEICRGLEYAHGRRRDGQPLNIVHRDICPNNVLVSMHAEVKVADFGIARASSRSETTGDGMIRGKPMFMSPEQALGQELDARSDLFSVGTVLFGLLTGESPFKGPADREFLAQIINTDAPSPASLKPELPPDVCRVVQKAMARDREQRFASAREMLTALEQAQRTALAPAGRSELETYVRQLSVKDGATPISRQTMPPVPNMPAPEWISLAAPPDKAASPQRRPSRWPVLVGGALALGGGAAFWFASQQNQSPTPPPRPVPMLAAAVVPPPPPPPPLPLPFDAGAEALVTEDAGVDSGTTDDIIPDAGSDAWAWPDPDALNADGGTAPLDAPGDDKPLARPPSINADGNWKLSARLAQRQATKPITAVLIESMPSGLSVRVDKKPMGKTPVVVRFRDDTTYNVWFEGAGRAPLRRWLMLTPKPDGTQRITLRAPVEPR